MGDTGRIEPVQSLATAQRSRIKLGEILRGTPTDHIDKRRMPILVQPGLYFSTPTVVAPSPAKISANPISRPGPLRERAFPEDRQKRS